jgi:hypothetical protein
MSSQALGIEHIFVLMTLVSKTAFTLSDCTRQ